MALHTRIAIYSGQTRFDLTFVSTSWRHPWDPTLGITLRKMNAFDRLSETYSPSTTKSRPDRTSSRDRSRGRSKDSSNGDRPESKDGFCGVGKSYDNSHSSYRTGINHGYRYRDRDRSHHAKRGRDSESLLSRVSKSGFSDGGYWKSKSKRHKPTDENDLTMPWIPNGIGDREDHVKNFQAAAQVERWEMPTWCHMFNSTLIGAARVWFDELPPESIDSYKNLKAAFLAYFMQQKKYVKDPVEIHNIKQKDGETIEDFMKRFKVETGRIREPLNTMEEIMITTTAFIRGKVVAASKKKGRTSWRTQDQSKRHTLEKGSDFRGQPRKGRGSSRFTPLTRTPKEILATEAGKFQPPPPMLTPVEKRSNNKFCDFHNDKGHNTDGRDQSKVGKKEAPAKDKPTAIYMIQSWQRMTSQKVTQSFERVREITFPSLATSSRTKRPLVIEAKIDGHMIHRMYVDGGSLTEVLYEHCFNRLRPEVKNQMVSATTSLTGFSGETIWPLGQLRLLVTIGDADHSTRAWMNFMIVRTRLTPEGKLGYIRMAAVIHGVPPSVAEHRLNIREGYSPVRQKKKGQALECAKAIQAEIQLAESDEEKTAFHTGQGVYCYTKMPFGLKNVGATYQRLVDKAFDSQIGRNIEVYVEDLVMKSHTKAEILRDIGETFRTLGKINMKLNPKKCTFGAVKGMFLGYMITPEGIKWFPDKTKVVLQLSSSRTIKEVKSLNWKLASLNRFLSKIELYPNGKASSITSFRSQEASESVMLGEHNITYQPRTSVKGQILADFLAEMSDESLPDASVVKTQQESWTLFTDGSSCVDRSGTGLILTSPEGTEFTYALRFQFEASNNEAEYEALIAGLRIVAQIGVQNVYVSVDSKLVANQVLGAYVAKDYNMIKYLEKVLVEILKEKSIQEKEVTTVVEEDGPTWITPIIEYLKEGTLPGDRNEARKLRIKALQYEILEGVLYRRSFLTPWLRCVGPLQADYVIREIHEGSCNMHAGLRLVVAKAIWLGYYWPTMHRDVRDMIRKVKILIVAMDYFRKLIEAKAVATITGNQAHRTMIKSSHGDTPFSLTYGTKAIIPAEIRIPTHHTVAVDVVHNNEELRLNLDLLEERRERVAIREAKSKLKMTKYYNARVRGVTFRPGDFVYRSNNASHVVDGGKLGPKWEGPYEVTEAFGDGSYKLRSANETVLPRT
nr:hypothetical protein [Tanacetum cinerariifolium]